MIEERRRQPRTVVEESALLSAEGAVVGCIIRNISADGAAIDVDNAAKLPRRFRLIRSDSEVKDCSAVWISQNRIGVIFD
jgi:hypothetical protein